ncbi:MAG: hypothetical protein P1P76_01885 [Anaerolineales bacterium]|nr:hypothetical protein [Anaerolineales bacterium]
MALKLLMTWDMVPGREQEYFEFLVREFVPGLQRLGVQPTEAWYTTYGDGPQMLAGFVAENHEVMQEALETQEWDSLKAKLFDYVTNFNSKVVRATGGFQL